MLPDCIFLSSKLRRPRELQKIRIGVDGCDQIGGGAEWTGRGTPGGLQSRVILRGRFPLRHFNPHHAQPKPATDGEPRDQRQEHLRSRGKELVESWIRELVFSSRPDSHLKKKISLFPSEWDPIPQDALRAVPGKKVGLRPPPAASSRLRPPPAESIEERSMEASIEDGLVVSTKKQKNKKKILAAPTCPSSQKKKLASGGLQ